MPPHFAKHPTHEFAGTLTKDLKITKIFALTAYVSAFSTTLTKVKLRDEVIVLAGSKRRGQGRVAVKLLVHLHRYEVW
jgi:hypothetical protein